MEQSNSTDNCGCKGIRKCLLCEQQKAVKPGNSSQPSVRLIYCPVCERAWDSDNTAHPHKEGNSIEFPGICVLPEFISREEEINITNEIDKTPWMLSQSGRQKQDYGPKVNFKRKKVKKGNFNGLPAFSKTIVERFGGLPQLGEFRPVELCNLEYVPDRGSAIDPHFDDFWLWGERLVTINLLSSTLLSFTSEEKPDLEVAVELPARSLLVVSGSARNVWMHAIHREDVRARRLAVTLRELAPVFLEGGEQASVGKEMLDIAYSFQGQAIGVCSS